MRRQPAPERSLTESAESWKVSICLVGCAAGYLVLVFTTNRLVLEARIAPIAIGGGTVMTKAHALFIPLMSEDEHGALTAFAGLFFLRRIAQASAGRHRMRSAISS